MANEDPTVEDWKPVVGYDGFYEVSNIGRVRAVERTVKWRGRLRRCPARLLTLWENNGYDRVTLCKDSVMSHFLVHRLVLSAFFREAKDGEVGNHLDFDRRNNRLENLEWTTHQKNVEHATLGGRQVQRKGESHPRAKLTEAQVREVIERRKSGEFLASIGKSFGVCETTIHKIANGHTWQHIPR